MRRRSLFSTLLILAASTAIVTVADAAKTPTCFGLPATHVMKPGDPLYPGTIDNDVVVGSSGDDLIALANSTGESYVCSGGGDDKISVDVAGSKVDAGSGDDLVLAFSGTVYGGAGNDVISIYGWGAFGSDRSFADGGAGNDYVEARDGALAEGGAGNDTLSAIDAGSVADGGLGSDSGNATSGGTVQGGSGNDALSATGNGSRAEGGNGGDTVDASDGAVADGGAGNDDVSGTNASALLGGSGNDSVVNNDGDSLIDCGSGRDKVTAGAATQVLKCET